MMQTILSLFGKAQPLPLSSTQQDLDKTFQTCMCEITQLAEKLSLKPKHVEQLKSMLAVHAASLNRMSIDLHRALVRAVERFPTAASASSSNMPKIAQQLLHDFEAEQVAAIEHIVERVYTNSGDLETTAILPLQHFLLYFTYNIKQRQQFIQMQAITKRWFATFWQQSVNLHPDFTMRPKPFVQKTFTYRQLDAFSQLCARAALTENLFEWGNISQVKPNKRDFFQVLQTPHSAIAMTPKLGGGSFTNFRIGMKMQTKQLFGVKIFRLQAHANQQKKVAQSSLQHIKKLELLTASLAPSLNSIEQAVRMGNGRQYKYYTALPLFSGDVRYLAQACFQHNKHIVLAWEALRQVSQQLEHFHAKQLIHLDIKPDNILFHTSGGLQLADFDFVTQNGQPILKSIPGTPAYTDPLLFQQKNFTTHNDIWSLGATVAAIANMEILPCIDQLEKLQPIYQQWHHNYTHNEPLPTTSSASSSEPQTTKPAHSVEQQIHQALTNYFTRINRQDKQLHNLLLNRILHPDPKQRLTVAQIRDEAEQYNNNQNTLFALQGLLTNIEATLPNYTISKQLDCFVNAITRY